MGFLSFLFSFTVEYKDDIHANDIIKAMALFLGEGDTQVPVPASAGVRAGMSPLLGGR